MRERSVIETLEMETVYLPTRKSVRNILSWMIMHMIIIAFSLSPMESYASRSHSSFDECNPLPILIAEICDNGIDDDGNGDVDCEDIACGQIENREARSLQKLMLHM